MSVPLQVDVVTDTCKSSAKTGFESCLDVKPTHIPRQVFGGKTYISTRNLMLSLWESMYSVRTSSNPFSQDLESLEVLTAYFAVAKRISLYLARPSPHATIDHLVHEVSLMMTEDSEASASYAAAPPLPGSSVSSCILPQPPGGSPAHAC